VLRPFIRKTLARFGFDISREDSLLLESEFQQIFSTCRRFSMASGERLYAVFQAVQYINAKHISGDLVECGVWRGGASMVAALTQCFGMALHANGLTNKPSVSESQQSSASSSGKAQKRPAEAGLRFAPR
jgi:hypothetical protein